MRSSTPAFLAKRDIFPPEFRELAEDEPFYDVALECENTRKRFKVPVEQFPPELVEIDERLEW